ncbi:MAG: protease modulator HflC [Candidatus Aminicenantes bacterium]|nr:protease modulator HflC [Candidatus Aminicenantes bacterium]MDH5714788.1 protease modulator HflC [Candidatus Aminicenantes bacterium]
MKTKKIATITIIVIVLLIVLASSLYTIRETEQVVITQFGRPVGSPVTRAGLHLKVPFVQKANYFEKRLLEWDGSPNQVPTSDKKYIWVDCFARWKIVDPLLFMQSVSTEAEAHARLDNIVDAAIRDLITKNLLIEVVRSSNREMELSEEEKDLLAIEEAAVKISLGREEITREILKQASVMVPQYGIELVDVRIKRINYVEEVRQKVYERMISERQRIAARYRSEGQGKRAEIEGEKEKELQRITSEAYRTAQEIIGKADAEAVRIYANAYNRDPEFYSFLKSLESYRATMDNNSWLLLTTEAEYLKYLKRGAEGR